MKAKRAYTYALYTIENLGNFVCGIPEDGGGGMGPCPCAPPGGGWLDEAPRVEVLNHLEVTTMSRKDYVAIAAAIRQNIAEAAQRKALAEALLPALRASNDRFNTQKFLTAAVG